MYIGYIVVYMDIQCITMLYPTIKLYKWIYHVAYHRITTCWAKVISSRSCLKFVEKEFLHAGHTLCLGCLGYQKPSGAGLWCVSSMWLQADTFPQNDIEFLQYPPKISEDSEDFPSIFRNPMPWPRGCPWCPWHCPSLSSKPPLLLDLFRPILNWKPRSTSPGKEDLKNTCPSINDNKSIINKYRHYH